MFSAKMIAPERALRGRSEPILTASHHAVFGTPLQADSSQPTLVFGMGCFWGAERIFWTQKGVLSTAVGYTGGYTPHPTYEEVCSGSTGHTEGVRVVFDPHVISAERLLQLFWEGHDPTQGFRQGNDRGTQYRSMIQADEPYLTLALQSKNAYEEQLYRAGYGPITTEITAMQPWYYAEEFHQQYLHKVPSGYCGLGGLGISCPIGIDLSAPAV